MKRIVTICVTMSVDEDHHEIGDCDNGQYVDDDCLDGDDGDDGDDCLDGDDGNCDNDVDNDVEGDQDEEHDGVLMKMSVDDDHDVHDDGY